MMVKPTNRELTLYEIIKPWFDYSDDSAEMKLKPEAPEEVRQAFEAFKKL